MKVINNQLIDRVSSQAKISSRKRQNFNFHDSLDAILQRMLNAIEPETYVQPHKHENPDKVEAFIILRGKALVVEFDNEGNITSHTVLSLDDVLGVEIPPRTWHTIISIEKGTVVYEVKEGPYQKINDKDFATWAPVEGDSDCQDYMASLLKKCNIKII